MDRASTCSASLRRRLQPVMSARLSWENAASLDLLGGNAATKVAQSCALPYRAIQQIENPR